MNIRRLNIIIIQIIRNGNVNIKRLRRHIRRQRRRRARDIQTSIRRGRRNKHDQHKNGITTEDDES